MNEKNVLYMLCPKLKQNALSTRWRRLGSLNKEEAICFHIGSLTQRCFMKVAYKPLLHNHLGKLPLDVVTSLQNKRVNVASRDMNMCHETLII